MAHINILSQAIAHNNSVAISIPSTDGTPPGHFRSRFLREVPEGFWIEDIPTERALVDHAITGQLPSALSLVSGARKLLFACPIYRRDEHFEVNPQLHVSALLLPFPTDPREVQRREWYRTKLNDFQAGDLNLRIWRLNEHADLTTLPASTQEIPASLRDIGVNGIGVSINIKNPLKETLNLLNCRVRVQMHAPDGELLLEGRVKFATARDNRFPLRHGIRFTDLDKNLDSRKLSQRLGKLVAALQREELRRNRTELMTAKI